MVRRKNNNLKEEEELTNEVRNFLCLYDKSSNDYKDKVKTGNAWKAVDEAVGLEDGEGQKLFENIKKKYSKKRIQLKKAKQSGAGRDDIDMFHTHLDEYSFLAWLDPYMKMRDTTTNIIPQKIPYDDEEEGYEEEYDSDGDRSKHGQSEDAPEEEAPEEETPVILRKRKYQGNQERENEIITTSKVTGQVKWKKGSPSSVEAELLQNINKSMTERSLIAEKSMGKINNLIFKYQDLHSEPHFDEANLLSPPHYSTAAQSHSLDNPPPPPPLVVEVAHVWYTEVGKYMNMQ